MLHFSLLPPQSLSLSLGMSKKYIFIFLLGLLKHSRKSWVVRLGHSDCLMVNCVFLSVEEEETSREKVSEKKQKSKKHNEIKKGDTTRMNLGVYASLIGLFFFFFSNSNLNENFPF